MPIAAQKIVNVYLIILERLMKIYKMNLKTHLSSIMIIFNFILFLRKCDDTYGENFSEKVKLNSN